MAGLSTLSFDWNFLSNDALGDGAGVAINDDPARLLHQGSTQLTPVSVEDHENGGYGFQTGWLTSTFTLPIAGDYTLSFVVIHCCGDDLDPSALLIDNIQVTAPRLIPDRAHLYFC